MYFAVWFPSGCAKWSKWEEKSEWMALSWDGGPLAAYSGLVAYCATAGATGIEAVAACVIQPEWSRWLSRMLYSPERHSHHM